MSLAHHACRQDAAPHFGYVYLQRFLVPLTYLFVHRDLVDHTENLIRSFATHVVDTGQTISNVHYLGVRQIVRLVV